MGAVALDNGSSSSGPRNRSPESTDTAIDAVENTVATGKLSEATDADGDELTYALAKQPANGRVTVDADGSYTYTPNKDFFGSDSFTYTIDDGQGGVITKKANITVEGVNDAPVSTDSSIDMVEVVIETDKGTFELSSDGTYNYVSKGSELGLDPEKLSEHFDVIVSDAQGKNLGVYRVEVEPDTTPPEPGELVFNNFEDTGVSQDDGITQDNTFDLAVQGNEAGSVVEFEYSSDKGKTWQSVSNGSVSYLPDGEYSFRARVTDEALNESITDVKKVTIDTTAPVLGQILNFNTATNTLEVDANIDEGAVKAYELVNGSQTELDSVTNIPFKEGDYRIEAADVAGNSTGIDFIMSTASEYFKSTDNIDIVKGSSSDDYIYGGNGADILIAEGGSDRLYGEDGDDTPLCQDSCHP